MNDYWNDPPDEPDLPACPKCSSPETDLNEGDSLLCVDCGHLWTPEIQDIEPVDEPKDEDIPVDPPPGPERCPHDQKWGDCGACDYLADIAFDAARESRRS